MVTRIVLKLRDDQYFALNYFKGVLGRESKKELTWEDFLCDWVTGLFERWLKVFELDKALPEAMKQIKPRNQEEFRKIVMTCIEDKLKHYKLKSR